MPDNYDPDEIMDPKDAKAVDLGAAGILVTGTETDPNAHPVHKMYAAINIGVRDRGERWAKCANCGNPYQLTEDWDYDMLCSLKCEKEYIEYVNYGASY